MPARPQRKNFQDLDRSLGMTAFFVVMLLLGVLVYTVWHVNQAYVVSNEIKSTGIDSGLPRPDSSVVPTVSATAKQQTVTLSNNNKPLSLKTGDSIILNLGDNYNWLITVSDAAVISRADNSADGVGMQGVYIAKSPGVAVLVATGDPVCKISPNPCLAPSILFSMQITVQ